MDYTDPPRDVTIDEVKAIRAEAFAVTGLTGSAGERGWYEELFYYFDKHRTGEEPVVPTPIADVLADLEDESQRLTPTVANRAIAGAYVLDLLSDAGAGPARQLPRFLVPTLAASPAAQAPVVAGGSVRPSLQGGPDKVGQAGAEQIANALKAGIKTKAGATFYKVLKANPGNLDPAAASLQPTIALRKVKREYCTVASTTADWPDIHYAQLKAVINPSNWHGIYPEFFCEMTVIGLNQQGWTRIVEAVSGDCTQYRLRTGLKFWLAESPNGGGLIINYDRDPDRTNAGVDTKTDKLVIVDNGYIWITELASGGVTVRTSKELLISGMSATALTQLAGSLGYANSASDMFNDAAKTPTAGMTPFAPSTPLDPATPDTSHTWPTMIPELPASLRDEMCSNATEFTKHRLDDAKKITEEYAKDRKNGLDLGEYDDLANEIGADVTKAAKEGFDMATSSFRPKPSPTGP